MALELWIVQRKLDLVSIDLKYYLLELDLEQLFINKKQRSSGAAASIL